MAKQINVVAAVVINGAKLLAGRREGGRLGEGFWELPGGKLKPGEDPRQALMRELKEELGTASYIGERVYQPSFTPTIGVRSTCRSFTLV